MCTGPKDDVLGRMHFDISGHMLFTTTHTPVHCNGRRGLETPEKRMPSNDYISDVTTLPCSEPWGRVCRSGSVNCEHNLCRVIVALQAHGNSAGMPLLCRLLGACTVCLCVRVGLAALLASSSVEKCVRSGLVSRHIGVYCFHSCFLRTDWILRLS